MSRSPDFPLEDVLASLDLSRAEPGVGLLEALFARFNARVPFETASKIERDAAIAEAGAKPRRPEVFWSDHLELGAGGTCFARVAAFEALLSALGFPARKVLGRVVSDFDHAATLVEASGREWLCDVGFPIPAILPLSPSDVQTAVGRIEVEASPRGLSVDLGGVPEGPRRLEIFLEPVTESRFLDLWQGTFRRGSKFLNAVSLRLQLENRAVSFAQGQIRVDDLHSRLTVPAAAPRAARLSEIFGIDSGLLERAFARVGDPASPDPDATLTAYLETDADPERAFGAIASVEGYRRLLDGVAAVSREEATPDGWLFRLAPPGLPGAGPAEIEDRVTPDAAAMTLRVARTSATSRLDSSFRVVTRDGKTWLLRKARLSGPRDDLLRNDSLRGRLAAGLAVDLLAWTRRIDSSSTRS